MRRHVVIFLTAAALWAGGCSSSSWLDPVKNLPTPTHDAASIDAEAQPPVQGDQGDALGVPATRASQAIEQVRGGVAAAAPVVAAITGGASVPWAAVLVQALGLVTLVERTMAARRYAKHNATAERIIQAAKPSAALAGELQWVAAKIEAKATAV